MFHIHCPWCGKRDEAEFNYGGQAPIIRPDPATTGDEDWSTYLYVRDNPKGWMQERWRHTFGCGQWFQALRHTVTHEIAAVFKFGEQTPEPPK